MTTPDRRPITVTTPYQAVLRSSVVRTLTRSPRPGSRALSGEAWYQDRHACGERPRLGQHLRLEQAKGLVEVRPQHQVAERYERLERAAEAGLEVVHAPAGIAGRRRQLHAAATEFGDLAAGLARAPHELPRDRGRDVVLERVGRVRADGGVQHVRLPPRVHGEQPADDRAAGAGDEQRAPGVAIVVEHPPEIGGFPDGEALDPADVDHERVEGEQVLFARGRLDDEALARRRGDV